MSSKHPITSKPVQKSCLLEEIITGLHPEVFPGDDQTKLKCLLGVIASAAFLPVLPHELLHMVANEATGGTSKGIMIHRLVGGDLYHALIPSIKSFSGTSALGKYVPASFGSFNGYYASLLAPALMLPMGLFLLAEGKKQDSAPLTFTGGILSLSFVGCYKDFYYATASLVHQGAYHFQSLVGSLPQSVKENVLPAVTFAATCLAMYCTYRFSRTVVNGIRKLFNLDEKYNTHYEPDATKLNSSPHPIPSKTVSCNPNPSPHQFPMPMISDLSTSNPHFENPIYESDQVDSKSDSQILFSTIREVPQ